jgi:hypothetical protein
MPKGVCFYRILHWTVDAERVNLGLYICGDEIHYAYRTLTNWKRASAFTYWDEDRLKTSTVSMLDEIATWTIVEQLTRYRQEMSELQLTAPAAYVTSLLSPETILRSLGEMWIVEFPPEAFETTR